MILLLHNSPMSESAAKAASRTAPLALLLLSLSPPLQLARNMEASLAENDIIKGFHSLLKDGLSQARGEGILTDEQLEVGDIDVQLAGPALALYFAALASHGDPPSITAPDGSFTLSASNCPPSLLSFFELWASCVAPIQRLDSGARHDLALILADQGRSCLWMRMSGRALERADSLS